MAWWQGPGEALPSLSFHEAGPGGTAGGWGQHDGDGLPPSQGLALTHWTRVGLDPIDPAPGGLATSLSI